MASDSEIGRVVTVDTAQVTVQLNADLKALTKTTAEGTLEIGRINSYVAIPVGARRLIAIVSRVLLLEEAELQADRTMVTLPSARRLMKATLVGTIDGDSYTQGVAGFPVLDNPVYVVSKRDLEIIFDHRKEPPSRGAQSESPGYCIPIGESAIFDGFDIRIDPDTFFGKHAAVLGSTGSGKSCTIASIVQSVLALPQVKRTHIVILDTNGEYQAAFEQVPATESATKQKRCLYIPSEPSTAGGLRIPYWFMDAEDFVRFFQASPGVQRPVLLEGLRLARNDAPGPHSRYEARLTVAHELNRLLAIVDRDGTCQRERDAWADNLV